ncbi:MAG: hypothetical protein FK733_08095 [Asgard group archaeon]|nr:hypothetical protein [Asgard group archaeon]
MKKLKFAIIAVSISLLFCPISTKGAYNVSVGDTFTYTVKASYWTATHGSNSDTVEKYRLFLDAYNVGTNFDVNVTNVLADEVEYDIITNTNNYSWSNDMFNFQINFLFFMSQPTIDAMTFASGWPTWDFDHGLPVDFFFFLDTDASTFSYFENWVTTPILTENLTKSGWENTHIEAYFDDSGAVAVFDWIIEGGLVYTSLDQIDIDGYYRLTYAFDKATGVFQGYHYESHFEGIVEGEIYKSETEQEVHLTGYSVPDFYFTTTGNYLPSFKWYMPILVLSSIILISAIIRKRK